MYDRKKFRSAQNVTDVSFFVVKLDILYFVIASFTWLLWAASKNHSYLRIKTTTIFRQVCCFNLQQGPGIVKLDSTKVGETDTRQPLVCEARR